MCPSTDTFVLETSSGSAVLRVGQDVELEVKDGRAEQSVQMPGGFHAIELETVQEKVGWLRVSWVKPGAEEEIIPSQALYVGELHGHGLLGLYRRGITWDGEATVVQLDPFIAPNDVLPSPFSIEWQGKVLSPASIHGDPDLRWKSPLAASTNNGSASMLPVPEYPP